jgi:putative glutamine amidotransferase
VGRLANSPIYPPPRGAAEELQSCRQGIRELSHGLRVCARDSSGIVQAVEAAGPAGYVIGVQWHPECLLRPAAHCHLFRDLVRVARAGAAGACP